jgi:hypothetical protein
MSALHVSRGFPVLSGDSNNDYKVGYWLVGSDFTDFEFLPPGQMDDSGVSVPGAVVGDLVLVGIAADLLGATVTAYVGAADQVVIVAFNGTSGNVDLSGAIPVTAYVWKSS